MRSLAVLTFLVLAVSKVSFAEETVSFCIVSSDGGSGSYCEVSEAATIKKFPRSMLAKIVSGKVFSPIYETKVESYNKKGKPIVGQTITHYGLVSQPGGEIDPQVLRDILYWMKTGDAELLKQRFQMDMKKLLFHVNYLELPKLREALFEKQTLGRFVEIKGGTYSIGFQKGDAMKVSDPSDQVTLSEYEIAEAAVTQESYVVRYLLYSRERKYL